MPLICCPACTFSKETAAEKVPTGDTRITCPQCQHQFFLKFPALERLDSNTRAENTELRELPFTFTGKAGEYFGIWIVNTLLKILTLGFYSPWAKIRKRRYFFGHTSLAGHSFDYLANPMVLLRGFIIGAVLFIAYTVCLQLSPVLGGMVGLLFFISTPWLIVRSRMFNNRYTNHRNLRFGFKSNYSEAYVVFVGLPFLTMITLGLAAPYVLYRQKCFLIANNRFGQTPFTFEAKASDYYRIFLRLIGINVMLILIAGGLAYGASKLDLLVYNKEDIHTMVAGLGAIVYLGLIIVSSIYLYVRLSNYNWDHTHLAAHTFHSQLKLGKVSWIIVSNMVAIACSAGLLVPWAAVRMTRYRVETLSLIAAGSLEHFVAGEQEEVSAIGEEIGDIFDIEIGI